MEEANHSDAARRADDGSDRQFGTRGGHGGTSVVLQTELADNGVLISAQLHPVMLDSEGIPRLDPDGNALPSIQELSDADFAADQPILPI